MKSIITPIICIFALLTLIPVPATAISKMDLSEAEFDFGYVPGQARISHLFWLKSVGDDTLKIVNVIPGCGCTKMPLDKSEIAAGDSARLEIIFNTGKYKGKVTKAPKIETNEGRGFRQVRFTAYVAPKDASTLPIVISPNTIDLRQLEAGLPTVLTFEIANSTDQDLDLELVDYPEDICEIDLPGRVENGSTVTGRIKLLKPGAESMNKSFTIEVDDPKSSRFTIPIVAAEKEFGRK